MHVKKGMACVGVGVSFETRVLMLIPCNFFAVQSAQMFGFCRVGALGNHRTLPIGKEVRRQIKEGERRYAVSLGQLAAASYLVHHIT